MSRKIQLRAHHGMCLSYFEGKGYSNEFTNHMGLVLQELEADNPEVCVITDRDLICSRCPNLEKGVCQWEEICSEKEKQMIEKSGKMIV